MGDFVKELTEAIWGESTLEMGFVKFLCTFVIIFVALKAWMWLVGGRDDKNSSTED